MNEMMALAGLLVAALAMTHGRAAYWKARAETLEKERTDTGWRNEAIFWRRHFDADATEWTEDNA